VSLGIFRITLFDMRSFASVLAGGLLARSAAAQAVMGFNSGSTYNDGTIKTQADFETEFTTAANLEGAPGSFSSVRLYTMVQGGTTSDPISAFQAAINTNTTMLLGIWCSGTTTIQNDLDALSKAIQQYGEEFARLVVGISVGSEDLYRNSVTGVTNKAGIGADPEVVAGFIKQTRDSIRGTVLEGTPIGHVDTWDVWGNATNKPVLDAIDFLGTDAYPYFQNNKGNNSIENAFTLWSEALEATIAAANGKPVWVTETGWPASGATWGQAVASVENAKKFWDDVGCSLFGKINTWWYILRDSNPENTALFAITENLSTRPIFDLTCPPESERPQRPSASASSSGASASSTSTVGGGSSSPATGGEASLDASQSSSSTGAQTTGNGAGSLAPGSFVAAVVLAAAAVFVL
jgi:glucan endo-1,3-beta-D-glucosidase